MDEAREARFAVQRLKRVQETLSESASGNSRRLEQMLQASQEDAERTAALFRDATQAFDCRESACWIGLGRRHVTLIRPLPRASFDAPCPQRQ